MSKSTKYHHHTSIKTVLQVPLTKKNERTSTPSITRACISNAPEALTATMTIRLNAHLSTAVHPRVLTTVPAIAHPTHPCKWAIPPDTWGRASSSQSSVPVPPTHIRVCCKQTNSVPAARLAKEREKERKTRCCAYVRASVRCLPACLPACLPHHLMLCVCVHPCACHVTSRHMKTLMGTWSELRH